MHPLLIKPLLLACALTFAFSTIGLADGGFWVVGNRSGVKCEIVTSNPVLADYSWFADGPYQSLDDAKLARSTISACPNKDMSAN